MSKSQLLEKADTWQTELVSGADAAKAFLERELKRCGVRGQLEWDIKPPNDHGEREFYINIDLPNTDTPIFSASGLIFQHSLIINMLCVADEPKRAGSKRTFRDENIFLIGLKALIGMAKEYCQDFRSIDFMSVTEDEARDIAKLSAMPEIRIDKLSFVLSQFARTIDKGTKENLHRTERGRQLIEAQALARDLPKEAFRVLSQIKPQKNSSGEGDDIDFICDSVIATMCEYGRNRIMVIDLKDTKSVDTLTQALGALPISADHPTLTLVVDGDIGLVSEISPRRDNDNGLIRVGRVKLYTAES